MDLFYDRLSQIMKHPHSLKSLTVGKMIDDEITYVESILKKCVHLDTLNLTLKPEDEDAASQWTQKKIKNMIIPNKTVKSLSMDFRGPHANEFAYYLKHKFLNLDNIHISFDFPLDYTNCSLFISYLNSIPRVTSPAIQIKTEDFEELITAQANLLDNVSSPSLRPDIGYGSDPLFGVLNKSSFSVSKKGSSMPMVLKIHLTGSRLNSDLGSVPFLERCGKFIRRMKIVSRREDADILTPNYLLSLFQNSPNLETLSLTGSTFLDFEWEGELPQEATLKEMRVEDSRINELLFVNFSRVVKTIRLLHLKSNQYYNIQNECGPYININMKSTIVGWLEFYLHKNTHRHKRYLFLNINTTRHGDLYYVYDAKLSGENFSRDVIQAENSHRIIKYTPYGDSMWGQDTSRPSHSFEVSSKEEYEDGTKAYNTQLSLNFHDLECINVKYGNWASIKLKLP